MSEHLSTAIQYLAPKQALTQLAGYWANAHAGLLTTATIRWFAKRYDVNMGEALQPDTAAYPSFNDFFTRALRPDARPLAQAPLTCPVDGAVSQLGDIRQGSLLQAKGHTYTTSALLGGDGALATQFEGGQFITLYLSPRDYHRIHMPCAGRLVRMVYIPGSLFSVNPTTARNVPGLFARNERVVCLFKTAFGLMAMTLVGATIVGSMCTVWHGQVNPPRPGIIRQWDYEQEHFTLAQGEEMGRFQLGSTVIMLLPAGRTAWHGDWAPGRPVRMGESMAQRL